MLYYQIFAISVLKISLIFLCLVDLTQPFYAEDVLIILLMDSNLGSEIKMQDAFFW
jgi:hypothetical protein